MSWKKNKFQPESKRQFITDLVISAKNSSQYKQYLEQCEKAFTEELNEHMKSTCYDAQSSHEILPSPHDVIGDSILEDWDILNCEFQGELKKLERTYGTSSNRLEHFPIFNFHLMFLEKKKQ